LRIGVLIPGCLVRACESGVAVILDLASLVYFARPGGFVHESREPWARIRRSHATVTYPVYIKEQVFLCGSAAWRATIPLPTQRSNPVN
jgi:hypothetical protein